MDDINNVVISYLHEHTGHTPRSIEDVQFLPKSDKLNERILEELRKGYNVRSVREYLQREYDSLPITNRDSYVNTVDVYNIFYKYREERCAKDTVDFASVKKWLDKFQDEGYHVWVDQDTSDDTVTELLSEDQFSFGFSAPWQKELLLSTAGKFISLDATHDVSQYSDGVMYTIVIRHPIVGRGIPVAYLITNDLSSTPLVGWFYSLASLGLTPQRITIDRDFAEDNALTMVWPGCTIQHCVWHVQRAWMINIKSKVIASVGRTTGQAKKYIRERLHDIMYENNMPTFYRIFHSFLDEIARTQPVFSAYFRRHWVDSLQGKGYTQWQLVISQMFLRTCKPITTGSI